MIWTGTQHSVLRLWRHGFTLIEMLAVIVILSLAAGLFMVNLSGASESARWQATISALRDLDARARLYSRTKGPVTLKVDEHQKVVALRAMDSVATLTDVGLPPKMEVAIEAQGPAAVVPFDTRGRSPDYEISIRMQHRTVRLIVSGLTGLIREEAE